MRSIEAGIEKLVVFLLPLPVFLSPSSPYLLARNDVWNDSIAFPLIFFITPLVVIIGLKNISALKGDRLVLFVPLFLFFLWVQMLSIFSLQISPVSLMYGMQWSLLFFWGLYFLTGFGRNSIDVIAKVFFYGAFLGSFYIFISGVLEILLYGALLDNGRMTQNLILKGQYQILIYVPTQLAVSGLLISGLYLSGILRLNKYQYVSFLLLVFVSIVFTGAREGLLLFVVGMVFFYVISTPLRGAVFLIASLFLSFAVFLNLSLLINYLKMSDIRIFNKIAALAENPFSGRGEMIQLYYKIIENNFFTGLSMLPPDLVFGDGSISAKSAHNFYVDTLAWTGFMGLLLILLFISIVVMISVIKVSNFGRNSHFYYVSFVVFLIVFVSSNINVPLRQPVIVPLFMFLISFLFRPSFSRSFGKD